LDGNKETLTSQLVAVEIQHLQIFHLTHLGWNRPYAKPSQNSVIKEVVDWSTIVFDGTILLPHGWIKIKKY
jgi:hypothetical protein